MDAIKIAGVLSILVATTTLIPDVQAALATSTVDQNGTKIGFNGNIGSASKIGTFDFNFPNGLADLDFTQARIRLSVQLPPEAFGDLAPQIVFAKLGATNLDQALISGDAIRTDIRISYNLFPSGIGVVEKQTDFKNLTGAQNLALTAILASDPNYRVDAWLVSDTLRAITVPASGEFLDLSGDFPISVMTRYDTTLDLMPVPEPSTSIVFAGFSLLLLRGTRAWKRVKNEKPSENNP
jgi:hypothetical protein